MNLNGECMALQTRQRVSLWEMQQAGQMTYKRVQTATGRLHFPSEPLSSHFAYCVGGQLFPERKVLTGSGFARRKFAEGVGIAFKTPEEVFG